jgi:hypothetical protein
MKMLRQTLSVLPLLLALVLASPANADLVKIDWDSAGRFEHSQDVAPGKFAEICGKLTRDQSVRWSFQAAAPLNFNIHYHEGKKVEYPAKQDGVSQLQGTLPVGLDQDYCWMWTNKAAAPVSLRVLLAH